MPLTPQITLTATLSDFTNTAAGSTASPAKLRIALCGSSLGLPEVPNTCTLTQIVKDFFATSGTPLSINLFGNDVITPAGTYYTITVLDGQDNVVQCGRYQFTGNSVTVDLSNATPMPAAGAIRLTGAVPNGLFPGSAYTLPTLAVGGFVSAVVFYNGGMQIANEDGNYLVNGRGLALFFPTQAGDALYALYATAAPGTGPALTPWISTANGVYPGTAYTLPTPPPNAQLVGVFYNGGKLAPANYTIAGGNLTLNFSTADGDYIQLLYLIGTTPTLNGQPLTGSYPGTVYTLVGTIVAGLWLNDQFQRPGIDYTLSGSTITMMVATQAGDSLYAI